MNRRELIQHVAFLMGGAISAPAVLGVLNGCTAKSGGRLDLRFFTEPQAELVSEVAEIMIPRTDTPGAKDVGVPAFIDAMLADAYTSADQARYLAGLAELDALARERHGRSFLQAGADQRRALVQTLHDEAAAAELAAKQPLARLRRPFILMTKELALLGYFTSRVGATQVLQYDPVPGAYRGCIPLSEAGEGRTWAVETSTRF